MLGAVVTAGILARGAGDNDASKPVTKGAAKAAFTPDGTGFDDCADGTALCLEQAYGNLAYRTGADAALDRFEADTARDGNVERNCHRIGHAIGAGVLMRNDGDVGKTFAEGRATCWSGYYHGILERAFAGVKPARLGAVAGRICSSPEVRVTDYLHYQCVHGIGHGLMIYTSYDLPRSLKICEQIPDDWESTSCDGGVFMENISSAYGIKSKYLRDDDPIYPCNDVVERHKQYCFLMVTSRIGALNGTDWKQTAATCATVKATRWRSVCFQSYGRDASGNTRSDPERMRALCRLTGPNERDCVYGAVRDVVSNDGKADRAARFCSGLATENLRSTCYNGMGTIVSQLLPAVAQRKAACRAAAGPTYARACEQGAAVTG